MASTTLHTFIRQLRRLIGRRAAGGLADTELLQRFLIQQDEAAFEVLLWRHGPMVWNVCQRVLRNPHDAEDAFQATFLVFVRKAGSIRRHASLSSWLYKVAYRVALKAKARSAQRARHETHEVDLLEAKPAQTESWCDLRPVLDEEVNRLPQKYRLPFVLCYLEGRTTDEAARGLGCPRGTVATRLAWARERLRRRLTRRGLALSAGVLATSLSQDAASGTMPTALVVTTVRSGLLFMTGNAAGVISAPVAALTESVVQAMTITRVTFAAALVLAVSIVATGAGLAVREKLVAQQREVRPIERRELAANQGDRPKQEEEEHARTDRYGDPLPAGAVARFGTLRWRTVGQVGELAFSPDGKVLASVTPSGAAPNRGLCFFDVASGKRTSHISPSDTFFKRIAFSPDGTRLACQGTVFVKDRYLSSVQLWDLPGRRKLQEFQGEQVRWLGWSANGQPLAVLWEKKAALIRNLATGKERSLKADNFPDPVQGLEAWPYVDRENILAVPDERLVIHIWDTAAGKERYALQAQGDHFLGNLALSGDGRRLASLTQNAIGTYYVQLWDLATGKATHRVAMDQKYIAAVAFSPDGKALATVGWYDVRIWDVTTGRERIRAQGVQSFAPSIAFSPDGKTLATAETHSGTVHLWDVATGTLKPQPLGHTNAPYELAISPNGRVVASGGGMDGTIFVWDPATGAAHAEIRRNGWVRGCAFSANGHSLYSCWTSDQLEFLDAASGRELYTIKLEDPDRPDTGQNGSYMRLSDDRKTLIAISSYSPKKGGAYIPELLVTGWDTATRKQLFRRRRGRVDYGLAISLDGKVLAASQGGFPRKGPKVPAGQGPIRLEDLATGEELVTFPVVERQTQPLVFSADARLLTTNTLGPAPSGIAGRPPDENAQTLRLWEVMTAAEILTLPTVTNSRVAFSLDGRTMALSAPSQEILLWDLRHGKELRRLKGFDADVTSLAFSPDGGRLVSGLSDSTLLVWDIAAVREAGNVSSAVAEDPAQAWADLGADARKAFAARCALADSPDKTASLLKQHLKPAPPIDVQRLRRLLADLDSDRFAVREEARKGLEEMGDLALDALRRALAEKPSLEKRQRIELLIEKLHGPITRPETLRALRGVAVLEDIATPEAKQVLATLAKGAPEARLTQEAKASLERLTRRPAGTP